MKKYLIIGPILIVVLFVLAWALLEPYFIEKTIVKVSLKNISNEAKNLTILHISDIHFKSFNTIPRKISEELIKTKPDYLFITGDIVNWDISKLDELKDFLYKISNIEGVKTYGVFGNHEYLSKKFPLVKKILEESSIIFLHNESVKLGEGINLIGLDDPHLKLDDIKKASAGIDKNLPTIILAHSPEVFERVNVTNSLILCGHTHGGQVNFPFVTNLLFSNKKNRIKASGLFFDKGKYIYINKGVGTTFLPLRFRAFPEIALIKLQDLDTMSQ